MLKKIGLVLVGIFIIIQFIRPAKNLSGDETNDIHKRYSVPLKVDALLQRSCVDCHTNKTTYPWYAEVEPVGWWLNSHIKDGKRHLNFSNFTAMRVAVQKKRMEDCIEQLNEDEMPLSSYTLIHRNAILANADKETLKSWCQSIIDTLKATYPADSLVLKRGGGR
ncbi:heme-binding domain-containing protein [Puia dinghuensis]|nr:heme-binding domain-containing protein [Puia dinghuensis]